MGVGDEEKMSSWRSLRSLLFLSSVSLHFIPVFSDDSSENGTKTDSPPTSSSGGHYKILIIFFVLVASVVLSFFLYKLWQKKKREDQYARLLKLFEQDDELELELGLRD